MTVSDDRWRQMLDLFHEAAELSAADRASLLEQRCGDDDAMRRAVERMLQADGEVAPAFLEAPLVVALTERTIGAYRLIEQIGEGGMGTVFLARRDDGAYDREVAVKLIRQGAESEDAMRRLRIERQVLADLDHPAIARLLDGGTTPEGLPYFVMEYIDGQEIDRYCDERVLSVAERLALFRQVCDAVDDAHRRLVVHCDLKPSNILVTPGGQAKLLDFGIAKLLDPAAAAGVEGTTASWHRRLTPSFASLEQIQGRRVTTASDVYSLGVLLYKLLTGTLPFRFENKSPAEIEHMLTHESPVPPSVRVRSVPEDLDDIVLKALRGEVETRYRSAAELAADLRRFETGFPVLARQGNLRYRLAKFVRRRRAAVIIAALLLVLTSVFAADRLLQGSRLARALEVAETQRDQARQERDAKEEVIDLIVDLFRFGDPSTSRGKSVTVLEVLDRSQARLDLFAAQPEVEATLQRTFGRIYLSLGQPDTAGPHLRRVLELQRDLRGDNSAEVAASWTDLGQVAWRQGEVEQADAMLRDAVERVRRLPTQDQRALLRALNQLVAFLCWARSYPAAIEPSQEALDLSLQFSERLSPERLAAVTNRAVVVRNTDAIEPALDLYRESLALSVSRFGEVHPDSASILNNLGVLWGELGESEKALKFHERALAARTQLYPVGHENRAQSLHAIGQLRQELGDTRGAEEALVEAFTFLFEHHGAAYRSTAIVALSLANSWLDNGQPRQAADLLGAHLPVWRERFPARSSGRWWLESTYGEALTALGRYGDAEALLLRALEVFQEIGATTRAQATAKRLVELYGVWSKPELAAKYLT